MPDPRSAPRNFYFYMALAMSFAVSAGFGPSFYLSRLFASSPGLQPAHELSTLIVAHGIVFTGWMVMVVVQTGLAASDRVHLHRKLGIAGAALAALVTLFGAAVQFASMQRDVGSGGYESSPFLQSVVFSGFFALIAFTAMAGTGVCLRRHPEAHKRLMILATIALIGAATARIGRIVEVAFPALGPLPYLGMLLTDLFLVSLAMHDWRTIRRLHPATFCGGLTILTMQVLGISPVPGSPVVTRLMLWLAS